MACSIRSSGRSSRRSRRPMTSGHSAAVHPADATGARAAGRGAARCAEVEKGSLRRRSCGAGGQPAPFLLVETTPHALLLAGGDRVLQARLAYRADRADRLRRVGARRRTPPAGRRARGRRPDNGRTGASGWIICLSCLSGCSAPGSGRWNLIQHAESFGRSSPVPESSFAVFRTWMAVAGPGSVAGRPPRRMRPVSADGPREHPQSPSGARGRSGAWAVAVLATAPGARWSASPAPASGDYVAPVVFGLAILGSAFLLAWAAEVLQLDVSQGLALTVLALIAVLPEYAVDFTFAWKAGEDPDKFAPLALANMTGAQPAPHRHRVVDGGARRRVADDDASPASVATRARSTPTSTSSDRTRSRSRSSRSRRCTR